MKKIIFSLIRVMAASVLITLVLMLLFSFIMLKVEVFGGTVKAFVIATYFLSTFMGGFIMGKIM